MVFTALFTAVLCAAAPFSIAIGPIPLSFATLVIYLTAGALGWKYGVISVMLYVAIGAIGIPVFSNFEGGFHKIAGFTGGFIIGYIPLALASGLGASIFRGRTYAYALGMVIGTVLLYTCGTAWFLFQTGNPLAASLALCVAPFLPGDAIKILLACIAAPQLRKALRAARTRNE
jgi:biotin transport system substrate-specific component